MTQDVQFKNQMVLAGYATAEPEMHYMAGGTAIARFEVCTTETWQAFHSGITHSRGERHSVVVLGRLAEIACEYLTAHMPVEVRGQLRTRRWRDPDNRELATTEVYADDLTLDGVPASSFS